MLNIDLKKSLTQLHIKVFAIYVGSLFFFLAVTLFSNRVLKNQAADQATNFIRPMLKANELRETIATLSQSHLEYFFSLGYFDEAGTKVFTIPPNSKIKTLDNSEPLNHLIYSYARRPIYFDKAKTHLMGNLTYAYRVFEYLPYAFFLWLIIVLTTLPLLNGAKQAVIKKFESDLKIKTELLRAELAKGVRHDIRSPLCSLQGLASSTKNLTPVEKRVLDRIVERILGIIADLEDTPVRSIEPNTTTQIVSMEEIIKDVVKEKQLEIKKPIKIAIRFEPSSFLAYSSLDRLQLSRIVSNILNNSIEAIEDSGEIEIRMRVALGSVILEIRDSGQGISSEILPKIFEKDFKSGKLGGSGVGLSSAKDILEGVHGSISAISEEAKGTTIRVELPIANQPNWWIDKIDTREIFNIVVLDDQETSLDAWRMKLKGIQNSVYLGAECDLDEWMESNEKSHTLFIVDYDLGPGKPNGIEVVRKLKIVDHSILVTGHYDDVSIRRQCAALKLRLLPKPLINSIAII